MDFEIEDYSSGEDDEYFPAMDDDEWVDDDDDADADGGRFTREELIAAGIDPAVLAMDMDEDYDEDEDDVDDDIRFLDEQEEVCSSRSLARRFSFPPSLLPFRIALTDVPDGPSWPFPHVSFCLHHSYQGDEDPMRSAEALHILACELEGYWFDWSSQSDEAFEIAASL